MSVPWTGVHIRALRLARRMTIRQFAKSVEVAQVTVLTWEHRGAAIEPKPSTREQLDRCLAACSPVETSRFRKALAADVVEMR